MAKKREINRERRERVRKGVVNSIILLADVNTFPEKKVI